MPTNRLIEQYELVKEIHFVFDNIEPKIRGRIFKIILGVKAKYTWDINYYCRLQDEADIYIPGGPFGETLEEIEYKFSQYINRFENAVSWRVNDRF